MNFKRVKPKTVSDSVLAATFKEAMRIWDLQKADGMSFADCVRGFAKTLQAAWPGQTREWKYLCRNCDDYGLVIHDCPGDATCGRHRPHNPHEFGEPCWCQAGARFKPRKPTESDFTEAGKTPSKSFSKVGRS